jgi:hypothetical protein
MNTTKDKLKYNESELNQAKDSLKLFKKKMGESSMNGNTGLGSRASYPTNSNNIANSNMTANNNYRKPFKPNFNNEGENENAINFETNKRVQVPRTQNNKISNNTTKQMPLKTQQMKEIDDDRPAFAQKNQKYNFLTKF